MIGQKRIDEIRARHKATTIIRPNWDEFQSKMSGAYVSCSCGQILQTFQAVREHWQIGHFDYVAENQDIPDLLDALEEAQALLNKLADRTAWLIEENERLRGALRRLDIETYDWDSVKGGIAFKVCVYCDAPKGEKHADDCPLKILEKCHE